MFRTSGRPAKWSIIEERRESTNEAAAKRQPMERDESRRKILKRRG